MRLTLSITEGTRGATGLATEEAGGETREGSEAAVEAGLDLFLTIVSTCLDWGQSQTSLETSELHLSPASSPWKDFSLSRMFIFLRVSPTGSYQEVFQHQLYEVEVSHEFFVEVSLLVFPFEAFLPIS